MACIRYLWSHWKSSPWKVTIHSLIDVLALDLEVDRLWLLICHVIIGHTSIALSLTCCSSRFPRFCSNELLRFSLSFPSWALQWLLLWLTIFILLLFRLWKLLLLQLLIILSFRLFIENLIISWLIKRTHALKKLVQMLYIEGLSSQVIIWNTCELALNLLSAFNWALFCKFRIFRYRRYWFNPHFIIDNW